MATPTIATISIQLPAYAVEDLKATLHRFLADRHLGEGNMIMFTAPVLTDSRQTITDQAPKFGREDYMKYLCEHREAVRHACTDFTSKNATVKSYNRWPVRRINTDRIPDFAILPFSMHWKLHGGNEPVMTNRPAAWNRRFDTLVCATGRPLVAVEDWLTMETGVVYATLSFDPVDKQWKTYVGQTKSLKSRWSPVATSTAHSHHRAIWEILRAVLNADKAVAPRDLLLPSFQLCDLAYAASIVDYFTLCAGDDSDGGVWLFLCEMLSADADKTKRDQTEQKWIDRLKPELNVR